MQTLTRHDSDRLSSVGQATRVHRDAYRPWRDFFQALLRALSAAGV